MGFWDVAKDLGGVALAPVTGGASLLGVGEDTLAKVPVVGALTGSQTDAQKALLKKQEEIAREVGLRREHMANARMNALGQQMLAFDPRNQLMAQMFGPQAAFAPEQFAQMAQNPMGSPFSRAVDPAKMTGQAGDDLVKQQRAYLEQEEARKRMLMGGIQQPGPGPSPIQMAAPQAARRY